MEQKTQYVKQRLKTDSTFRLIHNLRGRILAAIKNNHKSTHTLELLGCTPEEVKTHLENQFQKGMTWDSYGFYGWHIDHIIPLASFDLEDPKEQKKAFHYTNLQPLWAEDNLKKETKRC